MLVGLVAKAKKKKNERKYIVFVYIDRLVLTYRIYECVFYLVVSQHRRVAVLNDVVLAYAAAILCIWYRQRHYNTSKSRDQI